MDVLLLSTLLNTYKTFIYPTALFRLLPVKPILSTLFSPLKDHASDEFIPLVPHIPLNKYMAMQNILLRLQIIQAKFAKRCFNNGFTSLLTRTLARRLPRKPKYKYSYPPSVVIFFYHGKLAQRPGTSAGLNPNKHKIVFLYYYIIKYIVNKP